MDNNIDRKKLMDAVSMLSKNGALSRAIENKDFSSILSALPKNQADELSALMADKASRDKLLSSPQAQEIMRKLGQNGKQ